ncbi:unnamed protein product [Knipowitschia caucasica]
MSFQDADSQVINEHEINDLMNTVIDWGDSEGATGEDVLGLGAVDSEDEDYTPHISIRMGGASQAPPCLDTLPIIEASETVHDVPDEEPPSDDGPPLHNPDFPDKLNVINEEDLIGKHASIIYDDSL